MRQVAEVLLASGAFCQSIRAATAVSFIRLSPRRSREAARPGDAGNRAGQRGRLAVSTVVFVHGTGVRKDAYRESFERVSAALAKLDGVSVGTCYWGHLGSELHAGGASIPEYDRTRALEDGEAATATDEEYSIALWGILYEDPLYELRVLAVRGQAAYERAPGLLPPGDEIARRGMRFEVTPKLRLLLASGGIDREFDAARTAVTGSAAYRIALEGAPPALADYRAAVARALIAEAAARVARNDAAPPIAHDAGLRDETERLLIEALGGLERSIGGWVKQQLGGLVLRIATCKGMRQRGALSDASSPFAGDILLYQARGQEIRKFIREQLTNAAPPRVLLAHSLGGIACVDLLVAEALDVKLLITVGSQAPFLYEINALQSLPYGQPLPPHFPRWLNIYDLRDFLSYKGAAIFPGRVKDVKVDNKEPFHWSHSAYWSNDNVWKAIAEELR